MKFRFATLAVAACLAAPPIAAQHWSWDPLKDVQEALPDGVPNEGKIIQARQQVREMEQDALASLYEAAPVPVVSSTGRRASPSSAHLA
jgi:hypothetical protein